MTHAQHSLPAPDVVAKKIRGRLERGSPARSRIAKIHAILAQGIIRDPRSSGSLQVISGSEQIAHHAASAFNDHQSRGNILIEHKPTFPRPRVLEVIKGLGSASVRAN